MQRVINRNKYIENNLSITLAIHQECQYMLGLTNVKNFVLFLVGDSPASELYMPTFRNTLFHLHRWKNNRGEIVGVLIRKNFGSKIASTNRKERWGTGRGRVRIEQQAVDGEDLKWRPGVRMLRRNGAVSERGMGYIYM